MVIVLVMNFPYFQQLVHDMFFEKNIKYMNRAECERLSQIDES